MRDSFRHAPYVRLSSRETGGVTNLKGCVTRGHGERKLYFTAPIQAPSAELRKFDIFGLVRRGVSEPPIQSLQDDVSRFYLSALCVALKADKEGTFDTMTGKDYSEKVNNLYFEKMREENRDFPEQYNLNIEFSKKSLRSVGGRNLILNYDTTDLKEYFKELAKEESKRIRKVGKMIEEVVANYRKR